MARAAWLLQALLWWHIEEGVHSPCYLAAWQMEHPHGGGNPDSISRQAAIHLARLQDTPEYPKAASQQRHRQVALEQPGSTTVMSTSHNAADTGAAFEQPNVMESAKGAISGLTVLIPWGLYLLALMQMVMRRHPSLSSSHLPGTGIAQQTTRAHTRRLEAGRRYTHRYLQACRGDGNCFWRALGAKQWRRLKQEVRNKAADYLEGYTELDRQLIVKGLQRDQWVQEPLIRLAAQVLGISIAICCFNPAGAQWQETYRVEQEQAANAMVDHAEVRVFYHDSHYSAMKGHALGRQWRRQHLPGTRKGPGGDISKEATRAIWPESRLLPPAKRTAGHQGCEKKEKKVKTADGQRATISPPALSCL